MYLCVVSVFIHFPHECVVPLFNKLYLNSANHTQAPPDYPFLVYMQSTDNCLSALASYKLYQSSHPIFSKKTT